MCGKTKKLAEELCKHRFVATSHVLYQRESYAAAFFADSTWHGYPELQLHSHERCSSVSRPPQRYSSISVSVTMVLEAEQDSELQILCRMCDNSVNKVVRAAAAILLVHLVRQPPKM